MITPSGALSPGPLSIATILVGSCLGWIAGLYVALGHMVFELPYTLLLTRFSSVIRGFIERHRAVFSIAITVFILWFTIPLVILGAQLMMGVNKVASTTAPTSFIGSYLSAFITGFILTGANVFFLLWWVSVGLPLVIEAAELGMKGFTIMYAAHVWLDYIWLCILAGIGSGSRLLGSQAYGLVILIASLLMLIYAVDIMLRGVVGRTILKL